MLLGRQMINHGIKPLKPGLILILALVLFWAVITFSVKTVELVDGDKRTLSTMALTVHGALKLAGVELEPGDQVSPDPERALKDGTVINIERARDQMLAVTGKHRQESTLLLEGKEKAAISLATESVQAGEEIREEQAETPGDTIENPGNIIEREEKDVLEVGNVVKVMTMEATAYTHTGNPTATGIYPYEGIVAVDPGVIPLGSKLYVEGYGYCEAQDTGGAIKGNRIDIFLDSRDECFQWGRKKVQVYLLQ